jgi:hypothetical protein
MRAAGRWKPSPKASRKEEHLGAPSRANKNNIFPPPFTELC